VSRIEEKDAAIYTWIRSREEITKLLIECPKGIREIVTLAVGTGMRLDELIHLQWGDIDLDRRLIAVHRGRHGTTKSGKARYIPILDTLLPFLRELALKRGGNKLVFPGEDHKPRSKPGVRFPFKQAAKRAGLPDALRFHDLRHYAASRIMSTRRCSPEPRRRWRATAIRHNQSASRKATRSSSARNRPGLSPSAEVLARACSFKLRSACK
jgi:integrase